MGIAQRDRGADAVEHGRQRDTRQNEADGRCTVTARRTEPVDSEGDKDRAKEGELEISVDGMEAERADR